MREKKRRDDDDDADADADRDRDGDRRGKDDAGGQHDRQDAYTDSGSADDVDGSDSTDYDSDHHIVFDRGGPPQPKPSQE